MLVPSFLHGRFREVKAACSRKVTQLKRGAQWLDLVGDAPDEWIDTRDHEGLLVIDGPSSLLGGEHHFHFFAMAQALDKAVPFRLPGDTYVTLFEPMIHTRWGFLAILSEWGQLFLHPPGHQQRYLHLAARWWEELDAEGPRYTKGSRQPSHLWALPTNIMHCLAREGLPDELFDMPVPEGGLAELVALTRAGPVPGPDNLH